MSKDMKRLDQIIEERIVRLQADIQNVAHSTRIRYPESMDVRSSANRAEEMLYNIRRQAQNIHDQLHNKSNLLKSIAGQYAEDEAKIKALVKQSPVKFSIQPKFRKEMAAKYPTRFSVDVMKRFSLIDLIKYAIQQTKQITLEARLSKFREDEQINAYFEMLHHGNDEERLFAEQQLTIIKYAFDQLAQYQTEYSIYSKFGSQKYMDEAHQLAVKARAQLQELGVSEKWYAADVNLKAHYLGSPLSALRYDPYKTDGSVMPTLSEQRLAIALGMVDLKYQNWARERYDLIEAGAIAADVKRREIPLKVEEYNQTISKQNIEYVQQYLAEINLYRGETTGKYSPELLCAVERFQDNFNSSELSAELQYKFVVNGKIDHRVLNLIYMKKGLVEKAPHKLDMCLIPGSLEDTRSIFEKTRDYFNKSINSFKEIGSDIMVAADERWNKVLDSPGDFLNYISFGIPKGIYDGYAYRAENRNESAYTYIDWLSSGVLSGVYEPLVGAFNPDDPYSKEHWLDSAGLAAMFVGLGAARMQLKSNSKGLNTNVELNKTEKLEVNKTQRVVSEADRTKLSKWTYKPDDDLYLKYKDVYDNPKYYNQETGEINWPINDGFLSTPVKETLQPGFKIDRYGYDTGTFVSPEGIPYEMRAVAPGTDSRPYSVFEVVTPLEVKGGEIAPWFDAVGGGIQYVLPDTVENLLEDGIIRRITP
ncbi:TNT domain-containing protein [Paenibacillus bouchesdurhonensis]|uniref:TNT domain-containing protein n=1 Tax=Paenibacillus bouchesdurhonensis TaxID=1870990 RepID=UPI0018FFFCC9|nr:glycohydrolase toxin TNT-related protein [Paenibacillus bouchesdurhonensis]